MSIACGELVSTCPVITPATLSNLSTIVDARDASPFDVACDMLLCDTFIWASERAFDVVRITAWLNAFCTFPPSAFNFLISASIPLMISGNRITPFNVRLDVRTPRGHGNAPPRRKRSAVCSKPYAVTFRDYGSDRQYQKFHTVCACTVFRYRSVA